MAANSIVQRTRNRVASRSLASSSRSAGARLLRRRGLGSQVCSIIMTANAGSELARDYLARQNIPQLFEVSSLSEHHDARLCALSMTMQSLIAGLACHRPDDPISFLQRCLEEAKTREGIYSWNLFISAARGPATRSVFSRNKPLPPISDAQRSDAAPPTKKLIFFILGIILHAGHMVYSLK